MDDIGTDEGTESGRTPSGAQLEFDYLDNRPRKISGIATEIPVLFRANQQLVGETLYLRRTLFGSLKSG